MRTGNNVKAGKWWTSLDDLDLIFNRDKCCNLFLLGQSTFDDTIKVSTLHYGPVMIEKKRQRVVRFLKRQF